MLLKNEQATPISHWWPFGEGEQRQGDQAIITTIERIYLSPWQTENQARQKTAVMLKSIN